MNTSSAPVCSRPASTPQSTSKNTSHAADAHAKAEPQAAAKTRAPATQGDTYTAESSGRPTPKAPQDRALRGPTSTSSRAPRRGLSDRKKKKRSKRVLTEEKNLRKLGYDPGRVDGIATKKTADAVRDFRRDQKALDNGPGGLKGKGHKLLAKEADAFAHAPHRRRVKDTKAQRRENKIANRAANYEHTDGTVGIREGGSNRRAIRTVQEHLRAAGYNPKRDDGVFDERTAGAVKAFQRHAGLKPTGTVNPNTWRELSKSEIEAKGPTSPRQSEGEISKAVRNTEKRLKELGLNPGKVDGRYSSQTQDAVDRFRKKQKLGHKGVGVTSRVAKRLKSAIKRKNAPDTNTVRGAARSMLNSKNVSFWEGLSTGSDRRMLEQIAKTGKAYVPVTGQTIHPKLNMMRALAEMAKKGPIQITALTGGTHSPNSNHYRGTAVDLSIYTGDAREIEAIANKYGGTRNYETDHIHLDF